MGHPAPQVESVNGQEGEVELTAANVGAIPASTVTTAGDLIVGVEEDEVVTAGRLPLGAPGTVLHAKADGSGPGYSARLIDDGTSAGVTGASAANPFVVRNGTQEATVYFDGSALCLKNKAAGDNGPIRLVFDADTYLQVSRISGSVSLSVSPGNRIYLNGALRQYGNGFSLEDQIYCNVEAGLIWSNTLDASGQTLRARQSSTGVFAIDNGTSGQYRDLICRNATLSGGVLHLGRFTVATLPTAGVVAGATAFCDDGCKASETPGTESGTGVPVYYSGSEWLTYQDVEVQA